jgi:predicted ribosomally synthesized peptide with nif11-like leader
MSEQSAKAFAQMMGSDQAFRAGVLGEASIEGRMRMVQAAGFDCTADEIGTVAGLADDQMDGVVGGAAAPNQGFFAGTNGAGTNGAGTNTGGIFIL